MEVDTRQNLHEMSDGRSFGSNHRPSSQSRKMSIGIMIGSLAKNKFGAVKDNEVGAPATERENSNKGNSVQVGKKGKGVVDGEGEKETDAPEQASSPWITTKSIHEKKPGSETSPLEKGTSNLPATSGRSNKLGRGKAAAVIHSVRLFSDQTSILLSDDGKHKKSGGFTYKRKGRKDASSQRAGELTSATGQEVHVSDKAVGEDKTEERTTETLRMKLWEILGAVASPKSQPSTSQAHEGGPTNLKTVQKLGAEGKPKQNSDTIETDSESPDHDVKRPVTRSLTRKRASTKVQRKNNTAVPSSGFKRKVGGKSVFSLDGGSFRTGGAAKGGGSVMSRKEKRQIEGFVIESVKVSFTGKKNEDEIQRRVQRRGLLGTGGFVTDRGSSMSCREKLQTKGFNIEPRKIFFTDNEKADEMQGAEQRSETLLPAEKTLSLGNKIGKIPGSPQNENECLGSNNGHQEEDMFQSPGRDSYQSLRVKSTEQRAHSNGLAVPEHSGQQGDCGILSVKRTVDPRDDFPSPTFKVNSPILSLSPTPTPETDQIKRVVCSPAKSERRFGLENMHSLKDFWTSKQDCYGSEAQKESPDVAAQLVDSPPGKSSLLKGKIHLGSGLSKSSSDDEDSESSEEGSPIVKGRRERKASSPERTASERSDFMFHPRKRIRRHEDSVVGKLVPPPASPKGLGQSDWSPEPSEQNREDELERVTVLFALALERFKNKMRSATTKKSSEILVSVSEEIHLQLQKIQSQIRTDLEKLTSISKSKRKRLETRFFEQQEQLRLINEKFKQDILQHLQDCKNTVEELEGHRVELKGIAKKQKASHEQLRVQVEEAIETQINGAQQRITAVHESARKKMLQLRYVIAACLDEGVLG